MNLLNDLAQSWWNWVVPMFWQVSLLAVLVALVDRFTEKKLWPQVRYALWLLVFVKLVLPPTLSSPVSMTSHVLPPLSGASVVSEPISSEFDAAVTPPAGPVAAEPAHGSPDGPSAVTATQNGAESRPSVLDWRVFPMAAWFCGILFLFGWTIRRYVRLRRTCLSQNPAPSVPAGLRDLLRSLCRVLKMRRAPALVFSDRIGSPAVFGVFRPVLLLPDDYRERRPDDSMRHVLLHELCHIRRKDLLVHAAIGCLQILYWFQPLLWLSHRRVRHLRELCCDATVACALKEDAAGYRETLLDAAGSLLRPRPGEALGFLGLMENPGGLLNRLRWLERDARRHRRLSLITAGLAVVAMMFFVLPMSRSISPIAVGADLETNEPGENAGSAAATVADLDMSPEVRNTWVTVLREAGLEGETMRQIRLPSGTESFRLVPFRVYEIDRAVFDGRTITMWIDPGTGALIQWIEYKRYEDRAEATRSEEEVAARIEELAGELLPNDRVLVRGPEYIERDRSWLAAWRPTENGIPFEVGGYGIRVDDEDLSLRSYSSLAFAKAPSNMTPKLSVEEAERIATGAMAELQIRRITAMGESGDLRFSSDGVSIPDIQVHACDDPQLRIVPYDPGYVSGERSGDARTADAEMRLAWTVKMNVLVARGDGAWDAYNDELWIDASTGEVVGGDHLMRVREYRPEGGEVDPSDLSCW